MLVPSESPARARGARIPSDSSSGVPKGDRRIGAVLATAARRAARWGWRSPGACGGGRSARRRRRRARLRSRWRSRCPWGSWTSLFGGHGVVRPPGRLLLQTAGTVPTIASPSAMMTSMAVRSTMWCACEGVLPFGRSAISGPARSTARSTPMSGNVAGTDSSGSARTTSRPAPRRSSADLRERRAARSGSWHRPATKEQHRRVRRDVPRDHRAAAARSALRRSPTPASLSPATAGGQPCRGVGSAGSIGARGETLDRCPRQPATKGGSETEDRRGLPRRRDGAGPCPGRRGRLL
jgi:hypothetical protein